MTKAILCPFFSSCGKMWKVEADTDESKIREKIKQHFSRKHTKKELVEEATSDFMARVNKEITMESVRKHQF